MELIALSRNSKVPLPGEWQITDDPAVHREWIRDKLNIGLLTRENGLVAVDFDDKPEARKFWAANKGIFNIVNETARGAHYLFRGQTRTRKFEHGDIKGSERSFIVIPSSKVNNWEYRWVLGNLETEPMPFPEHLFPERVSPSGRISASDSILERISRARKYVEKCEGAISGEGGHAKTFRIACKLVRQEPNGFGLSIEQAWPLMLMFNDRCSPPWDEKSLIHKLSDAALKG